MAETGCENTVCAESEQQLIKSGHCFGKKQIREEGDQLRKEVKREERARERRRKKYKREEKKSGWLSFSLGGPATSLERSLSLSFAPSRRAISWKAPWLVLYFLL